MAAPVHAGVCACRRRVGCCLGGARAACAAALAVRLCLVCGSRAALSTCVCAWAKETASLLRSIRILL